MGDDPPCGHRYPHLAHHYLGERVYAPNNLFLGQVTEACSGWIGPLMQGETVNTDKAEGKRLDAEEIERDLTAWWQNSVDREIRLTAPKAAEYGAADLPIIGQALMSMNPDAWAGATPDEREQISNELGIAFYTLGKVARLFGAYAQGKIPSDDTWFDIGIYTKMAQRNRDAGGWPA